MRIRLFLDEALESLRRNWVMTIASILTVLVTMAVLGLVLVTDRNLAAGTTSLKNRVKIEVYIRDDATQAQIGAMGTRIASMPEVKRYDFVTKDEALRRFRLQVGPGIVDKLPTNPLPASYEIYVKDANLVDRVAARFFDDPIVDNTAGTHDGVAYARATVRSLLGTINLVEKGMWVVTILFALAAVLLTSTTVRLSIFARRREVEIMQLVGATNWFIRWPFVMEGFITGFAGAFVAALVVWGANVLVYNWIHDSKLDFLKPIRYPLLVQGGRWPLGLIPTLVVVGAVLGALGSTVALRRYLRV